MNAGILLVKIDRVRVVVDDDELLIGVVLLQKTPDRFSEHVWTGIGGT
jgi:hypothetical protein